MIYEILSFNNWVFSVNKQIKSREFVEGSKKMVMFFLLMSFKSLIDIGAMGIIAKPMISK